MAAACKHKVAQVQVQVRGHVAKIKSLEEQLAEEGARYKRTEQLLQAELQGTRDDVKEARAKLASAEGLATQRGAEVDALRQEILATRGELEDSFEAQAILVSPDDYGRLESRLKSAEEELVQAQSDLKRANEAAKQDRALVEVTETKLERANNRIAAALQSETDDLAAVVEELTQAEQRLQNAEQKGLRHKDELAAAKLDLEDAHALLASAEAKVAERNTEVELLHIERVAIKAEQAEERGTAAQASVGADTFAQQEELLLQLEGEVRLAVRAKQELQTEHSDLLNHSHSLEEQLVALGGIGEGAVEHTVGPLTVKAADLQRELEVQQRSWNQDRLSNAQRQAQQEEELELMRQQLPAVSQAEFDVWMQEYDLKAKQELAGALREYTEGLPSAAEPHSSVLQDWRQTLNPPTATPAVYAAPPPSDRQLHLAAPPPPPASTVVHIQSQLQHPLPAPQQQFLAVPAYTKIRTRPPHTSASTATARARTPPTSTPTTSAASVRVASPRKIKWISLQAPLTTYKAARKIIMDRVDGRLRVFKCTPFTPVITAGTIQITSASG